MLEDQTLHSSLEKLLNWQNLCNLIILIKLELCKRCKQMFLASFGNEVE